MPGPGIVIALRHWAPQEDIIAPIVQTVASKGDDLKTEWKVILAPPTDESFGSNTLNKNHGFAWFQDNMVRNHSSPSQRPIRRIPTGVPEAIEINRVGTPVREFPPNPSLGTVGAHGSGKQRHGLGDA